MTIQPKHLAALRCPVTKRPLDTLPADSLNTLNERIQAREIVDNGGRIIDAPLDDALITDTGSVIYPVTDGVPVLLEIEGIASAQINAPDSK